jgi:hypothetical protein
MQKLNTMILLAASVWMLCSKNVAGQEPADSVGFSAYSHSEVIIVSDIDSLAMFFPLDSMIIMSSHSPAKAAIMSAVMPGLGQIYNRKYWKLPIVYAAVGASVFVFLRWQNEFSRYRRAYIDIRDGDPYTNYHLTLGLPAHVSLETVITRRKDQLRTWRDWSIVAMAAAYALNIIDANVDAHLMDFNLDDNISLNIRPCFLENGINSQKIGLSLRFTF